MKMIHFLVCEAELDCYSHATGLHLSAIDELDVAGCHDYQMAIPCTVDGIEERGHRGSSSARL